MPRRGTSKEYPQHMLSSFPFFMHFNRKYGQFYPNLGSDYISFRKVVVMTAVMGHLEVHCKNKKLCRLLKLYFPSFCRQIYITTVVLYISGVLHSSQHCCSHVEPVTYCAFDIFQKVVLCLALYTEEVNLQTFVVI